MNDHHEHHHRHDRQTVQTEGRVPLADLMAATRSGARISSSHRALATANAVADAIREREEVEDMALRSIENDAYSPPIASLSQEELDARDSALREAHRVGRDIARRLTRR